MLTITEVAEITGLNADTIAYWVRARLVRPQEPGGKGRGHKTVFSIGQCFGFAMLAAIRDDAMAQELSPQLGSARVAGA
jgi:hypothetical protein